MIDLPDGTSTPGGWDLRGTAATEIPWPELAGKRCLDVGTADGFRAFEMERRGAADVLATDIPSPFQARARAKFELARELRGSGVRYGRAACTTSTGSSTSSSWASCCRWSPTRSARSSPSAVSAAGTSCCSTPSARPSRCCPRRSRASTRAATGREWFVFDRRGLRKLVELAGWTVEAQTGILADRPGPLPVAQEASRNWKWRVGARGRSCAILAS